MYDRIRRDTTRDFPEIVQNINDVKMMCISTKITNNQVADNLEQSELDMYFDTMSEDMVKIHEAFLELSVNSTDTIQFRRERIKSRYDLKPPFTRHYMKSKLDQIIGVGKYDMTIDCMNKSIVVECLMDDKPFYNELYITFNLMKPCSMVFITKPYAAEEITTETSISYNVVTYHKFSDNMSMDGWQIGKLSDVKGVEGVTDSSGLISLLLSKTSEGISTVKINNILEITALKKEIDVMNKCIYVNYTMPASDITEITNIKVLSSDGTVLQSSNVYVPNYEGMLFKQKIAHVEKGDLIA